MKMGTLRRLDALASDGVERAEDGGPPTAFRIWRAGSNVTDHGPTLFTERSAALLLAEQKTRGNCYSMDINHLSLKADAPLENQRAVGFFSLEVRAGELWATGCVWTDLVRDGLTKDPPEWKYFSPAYDVDVETGEVVSFLNCALTNTPATHHVTALATRRAAKRANRMDEKKKAALLAAIEAAFADDDKAPDSKKDADGDDKAPDSKKDADGDDKAPDSKKEEPKKDAKASVVASQDKELATALARIAALEAKDEATARAAVMASREMTKPLAASLAKLPLATVKEICATLPPKAKKDLAADAKVTATRGDTQTGPAAQEPSKKEEMDVRMGLKRATVSIKHDGRTSTFDVMTADDAKRHIEAKQKGGAK
jgi:hypothetical protein